MEQAGLAVLSAWETFYVIIGAAAGALIGLQFVVITLSAESNIVGSESTTGAFATPTIIHFCAVLFIAAIVSAPWPTLAGADLALGVGGLAGTIYAFRVTLHAQRQTDYEPVLEDWIWHSALPLTAYFVLLVAAVLLQRQPLVATFMIGGTALLLLFIGIHNAWDSVVYIAQRHRHQEAKPERDV